MPLSGLLRATCVDFDAVGQDTWGAIEMGGGVGEDLEESTGYLEFLWLATTVCQGDRSGRWSSSTSVTQLIAAGMAEKTIEEWVDSGRFRHAVETTGGLATRRTFDTRLAQPIGPRSHVLLTDKGKDHVRSRLGSKTKIDHPQGDGGPRWSRAEGVLFVGKVIVKKFRHPGENQYLILDAFEEEGWPREIDNPIAAGNGVDERTRLKEAVHSLNRNQLASLVKFGICRSGQRVSLKSRV